MSPNLGGRLLRISICVRVCHDIVIVIVRVRVSIARPAACAPVSSVTRIGSCFVAVRPLPPPL